MTKSLPLLIAGGGIGGLAAALSAARSGHTVSVLERAPELGEIGAGIQLGPNAFHVFDRLGIGEQTRRMAVFIDSLLLMDAIADGEICRIPLGEAFRDRYRSPYAVIHRGDMHGVLLAACRNHPAISLRTGCDVADYEQDAGSVTAILTNGERVRGSALVGADGLWSNIRARVVSDGHPRVSGHSTYRSVIPTENMPEDLRWNAATLWAGPKCHIVHYPLSGWKVFNLVVTYHNQAPAPVSGQPVSHEEVSRGFEHVCPRARSIISHGTDWKLWVLCDRDPVSNWQDGRVVLLGDAAHPMMQYMAQGACMAMEDAVALGDALAARPHAIEDAFSTYQTARILRTARVQLQSRWIGENIYHPDGAHALLRNAIMSAKSEADWYQALDWIYGGAENQAGQRLPLEPSAATT